jgi:hypothetical protein
LTDSHLTDTHQINTNLSYKHLIDILMLWIKYISRYSTLNFT